MHVGHVVVGDEAPASGRLTSGSTCVARRLAAQLGDRLLEHLRVQVEADRGDGARLLRAEQVAGAADLQVVRGDREAGAELGERLQHLEPPLGVLGDGAARRAPAGSSTRAPCERPMRPRSW